jgi:hypothetical protein
MVARHWACALSAMRMKRSPASGYLSTAAAAFRAIALKTASNVVACTASTASACQVRGIRLAGLCLASSTTVLMGTSSPAMSPFWRR